MTKEIFILGIGGQGALTIGDILMIASQKLSYSASFYPFYGSQMRGGESGCIIKVDTKGNDIINPTINSPDYYLILNDKFFDKYKIFKNENSKIYNIESNNDKNSNLKLLKKFIDDNDLFNDDIIIESIKEKFKKEEIYNFKITIYKGEDI